MKDSLKILICGVGGQGVVFITNLLVKASMLADVNVWTSEVHGLAQRGGSVKAGLTFGEHTTGFIDKGSVHVLLGFEPLEVQRNISFLNHKSIVVVDNKRVLPNCVHIGMVNYPDTNNLFEYLQENVREVLFLDEELKDVDPVMRNIFVLGVACSHGAFPFDSKYVKKAIELNAKKKRIAESLKVFESALMVKDIVS